MNPSGLLSHQNGLIQLDLIDAKRLLPHILGKLDAREGSLALADTHGDGGRRLVFLLSDLLGYFLGRRSWWRRGGLSLLLLCLALFKHANKICQRVSILSSTEMRLLLPRA